MKGPTWTDQEDARIRSEYPKRGSLCFVDFPGRTQLAVRRRAKDLGVNYAGPIIHPRAWSAEDEERLRELWPRMGSACADMFPGREGNAIKKRAQKLRLRIIRTAGQPRLKADCDVPYGVFPEGRVRSVFELGAVL